MVIFTLDSLRYPEGARQLGKIINRGTASISEKNHAKKIRVKKSENISLFQDTYSVFFYTKNNTTQY
ncbi:hypothetical protein P9040_12670 [Bacillus thuringiensis]|nr:hypothetical protein [Bacillus thuringiensis]MEC3363589.1 hypothetical protein [Bacillus thuringiensis]MED2534633.1 hypothetical protein [Bacillus thuringiensis]